MRNMQLEVEPKSRILTNEFANERNWNKYHTPRNLLLAMIGEVGELSELFQWRGEVMEGLPDWSEKEKEHLGEELSDVLIYLLRLSEKCKIDLPAAVLKKISKNKEKYPPFKVWGSSKKYTEYEGVQPVRLAYNTHEPVAGSDESLSPIIYLHGATSFKESWGDIPQVVANATKRRSYSLDARNHGDSEWNDYFNFDVNVDDLIHFMDTLGLQKAILVGHSMGGVTAIKTALKRPDRVEKVIIEDMFVRKCSKEVIDVVLTYISLLQQAIDKAPPQLGEDAVKMFILQYLMANLPPILLKHLKKDEEGLESKARFMALRRGADGRFVNKCNLAVVKKAMENLETLASEPEGRFDGPACFIYGEMSPFLVGADEHHIRQYFPKAVFTGIEDADHNVHPTKPLEFTDSVIKFLS